MPRSVRVIRSGTKSQLFWGIALGIPWVLLFRQLALHWAANPQYSFGWLMPVLFPLILHARWSHRPKPGPDLNSPVLTALIAGLACLIAGTWFLLQPSPDWRLLLWLLGFEAAALSLAAMAMEGGRPWAWHFAFPFLFPLAAIPWPANFEISVVQNLMRAVAAVAVELLNLVGITAVRQGNAIELLTSELGVDEACSGVRSLQATLVAALFLGEWFRLTVRGRAGLVVAGAAFAFITNTGRAFLLAWISAREGTEAVQRWHDPAGFTILTICFVALLLFARQLPEGKTSRHIEATTTGIRAPVWLAWSLLAAWAATLTITEWWFRSSPPSPGAQWTFVGPSVPARQLDIAPKAAEMLLYDSGKALSWSEGSRRQWTAFFFQWKEGPARSRILARMHRPDVCLPASGISFVGENPPVVVRAGNLSIPFRAQTFLRNGEPVFVFYCPWEDTGMPGEADFTASTRSECIRAALRGQRNLGQQVLELVLTGFDSAGDASAAVQTELPSMIQTNTPASY